MPPRSLHSLLVSTVSAILCLAPVPSFARAQVVRIVRAASSPQQAASLLTKSAFVAGSLDNLTAVVVALKGYKPQADGHPTLHS
eukprot:3088269-Pleurochrysis_carterae.AAC.1